MSWEEAGTAWGWRAAQWAHLAEPVNRELYLDVLDALEVASGDRLLDVACGSGYALGEAAHRGAHVAGIDASRDLVEIAKERVVDGDIRAGDMTDLPWSDDSFDVVTTFNGAFNVDEAFAEARRVLRPAGRFAMAFWGHPDRVDLHKCFTPALMELSPPDEIESGSELLEIGKPGVAEERLEQHGFTPEPRSTTTTVGEFADVELATTALLSNGLAYAAVRHSGEATVTERVRELLRPFESPTTGMVRFSNEWGWITATA